MRRSGPPPRLLNAVANRNKGRAARSRKRRPPAAAPPSALRRRPPGRRRRAASESARRRASGARAGRRLAPAENAAAARRGTRGFTDPLARRRAPAGAVAPAAAVGAADPGRRDRHGDRPERGGAIGGCALLIAGLGAVLIGTVEVTLREHLSGYRSHTIMLALLPTVVLYTGAASLVAVRHARAGAQGRPAGARRAAVRAPLQTAARALPGRAPRARLRGQAVSERGLSSCPIGLTPSSEGSGAARARPASPGSPRVSPLTPSALQARDLALAFHARRVIGGQAGDQLGDAFAQLKREVGGGGAHQPAHVLDASPRWRASLRSRRSDPRLGSSSRGADGVVIRRAGRGGRFFCWSDVARSDLEHRVEFGLRQRSEIACSSPISQP